MDHLVSYKTRQLGYWVQVPYLGEKSGTIWTPSQLFTFPQSSEFWKDGSLDLRSASPEEYAKIIQRWLYFGLLREFFLVQDIMVSDEDFTSTTPENKVVVTTASLPALLFQWRGKEMGRTSEGNSRAGRIDRVKRMLNYVRHNTKFAKVKSGTETFNIVRASIQVLGYTIANEMKTNFPRPFLAFHPGFGSPESFMDCLLSRQWCPRDVAMLGQDFFPDLQFYCTMISPPRKDFSHTQCSDLECKAMNINEKTYQTQHVSRNCGCAFLESPSQALHQLVDQLAVPLVRYQANNIQITELKMDEPNVVFSHVWVDGLGNVSGKNALPTCQVIRLQEIANMAFIGHESKPIPFYIDTLCVPRKMELRGKAIRKMKDVYKSAMKVMVLDREIEALSSDDSITKMVVRIYFSGWMRRLWTYQEGALNKSLFFKLADCILPLDSMRRWFWEVHDTAEAGCVRSVLALLTKTLEVQDTKIIPPTLFFVIVRDALHWRSTSRSEDEAFVITILLGLDTESVLKAEGTERMKTVLQSVGRVPLALAVLSSDRMEEDGYTWAPKSFLTINKYFLKYSLGSWYSNMLRINPQIARGEIDHEVDVANVLETGALSFHSKGYAILPGGLASNRISSPFWLLEVAGIHGETRVPMVEKCLRVLFWSELKGMPEALPQEIFFLVPVEEPHRNSFDDYLFMNAFIVLTTPATRDFVQKHFSDEELSIDVLSCRFYCRVQVCVMAFSTMEVQPVWKAEIMTDSMLNAHMVRPIKCQRWIVS
ncbi:hypothetical protein ACHAPA_010883 [Fusarium lateritium]